MMKAVIDAAGKIVRFTPDPDGMDLEGCTVVDVPDGFDPIQPSHEFDGEVWRPNREAALARLRIERDARLARCDWTQLADIAGAVQTAWQPYRQALRELPGTADPFEPVWPDPPQQENES